MAQFSTVTDRQPDRKATVAPTAAVQRKNLPMMLSRYGSFCGLPTLQHRELHALVASWLLPGFIVDAREYRLLSIFFGGWKSTVFKGCRSHFASALHKFWRSTVGGGAPRNPVLKLLNQGKAPSRAGNRAPDSSNNRRGLGQPSSSRTAHIGPGHFAPVAPLLALT